MNADRPRLAVAIVCALTIAGLLAILLRRQSGPDSTVDATAAPHLYDQPFRGAPLASPSSN